MKSETLSEPVDRELLLAQDATGAQLDAPSTGSAVETCDMGSHASAHARASNQIMRLETRLLRVSEAGKLWPCLIPVLSKTWPSCS